MWVWVKIPPGLGPQVKSCFPKKKRGSGRSMLGLTSCFCHSAMFLLRLLGLKSGLRRRAAGGEHPEGQARSSGFPGCVRVRARAGGEPRRFDGFDGTPGELPGPPGEVPGGEVRFQHPLVRLQDPLVRFQDLQQSQIWVGVGYGSKLSHQELDRRCSSMFPFIRVPVWVSLRVPLGWIDTTHAHTHFGD